MLSCSADSFVCDIVAISRYASTNCCTHNSTSSSCDESKKLGQLVPRMIICLGVSVVALVVEAVASVEE